MELGSLTVLRNGNQSLSRSYSTKDDLPKYIFVSLIALMLILIGTTVRKDVITRLASMFDFAAAKSTKGIPLVSTWALVRSILLHGTDLQKIMETAVAKYGGIFKLNLLGLSNIVFITNPSLVQEIYISTEPGHLNKTKAYDKALVGVLASGLVGARFNVWKTHRSVASKVFTYKGLIRQLNIFEEHAKKFVLTLQESCVVLPSLNPPVFTFQKQVDMLIHQTILHIAAGKEMHDVSEEEKTQYHHNYERCKHTFYTLFSIKSLMSYRISRPFYYMDFTWNLCPQKWKMGRRMDAFYKNINKLITRIRKQLDVDAGVGFKIDDDLGNKSLVEVMIKAEFSDDEIFAEVSAFLAAGQDTVSTTLSLVMCLLASHPHYKDKCREEIDQMFNTMSSCNLNEVSMEAISSLTFVDMCIKECLRLYPLFPIIGRGLESSIQLNENLYLPAGTDVYVSPWIIHRDPNIYPEPEKYNPERFSPENVGKLKPCEYMPFSTGPRNCIGFKSATLQLKILVAYVLHNFDVQSNMTIDKVNQKLRKTIWPFPDLGVTVHSRA